MDNNVTYTATGDYDLDEETQDQVDEGEASVSVEYIWSYSPAELIAGGGTDDSYVSIRYDYEDGGAYRTVSVTYKVTVTYKDETSDSDQDSDSIQVAVSVWKPYTAIQCDGITTPEDDNAVCVGQEVSCSVATPSDNDERAIGPNSTYPADTFNYPEAYVWEASAGSFKDGGNKGQTVTWIAPSTSTANITIGVTVDDDAIVPEGERGTRDDEAFEDEVKVTVFRVEITGSDKEPGAKVYSSTYLHKSAYFDFSVAGLSVCFFQTKGAAVWL